MASSIAAILARAPAPSVADARKMPGVRAWHRRIATGHLLEYAMKRAEGVWKRERAASEEAVGELYRPLRAEVLDQFPPYARRLARAA